VTLPDLHADFETRSTVDLKKQGVYVYAEHPDTDVWCMAYAFGDGPVKLWVMGEPCPPEVKAHVENNGTIVAFNAAFERIIWWAILSHRYGWPKPKVEQFRCVMVQCMAMSLPASLEMAAPALGITAEKDMQGHRLMMQMSKPRKVNTDGSIVWWDDAERRGKLYAYCKQDIIVERMVDDRTVPLRPSEQQLWYLDQRINDRGVRVDVALCKQASKVIAQATEKLDKQMAEVTDYDVTACSQAARLIIWLKKQGVDTDSVAKDKLTDLLALDTITPAARRALELRKEGSKSSTAKIDTLLRCINRDGRARGLLQFHGAGTGRWAGRRFQPQNLKRPDMEDPEKAVPAIMTGDASVVEALYDNPLSVISDCTRSMLWAAKGRRLKSADFANIEGRVLAWLANEAWKLQAFRDYDAGTGPDLYKVAAGGIFGLKVEAVDKKQRQIGKVSELSMGYEGGVGAFVTMAPNYQLKIADHYDAVMAGVAPEFTEAAREKLRKEGKKITSRWDERTFLPAESIKLAWRARHPATVALWRETKDAAIAAIASPGRVTTCAGGRVKYRVAGSFLWCQLPSGRCLCYPYPSLKDVKTPWGTTQPAMRFKGVDSYTRKWGEQGAYGGFLVENIVQAVARDLMAEAMVRVDAVDPIILTVHDELLSESENEDGIERYEALMEVLPSWAAGCPVTAEGWVGERYRK
jgi:DNA polymerase